MKEEPTVKVEASNFFPGLPDPRKTWEIIQQVSITWLRLNPVVSEYCPWNPAARLTPKTKARAPGEARILIMQSRSLLGSKPQSWPIFHNLIDISCCSVTLKEHHSHSTGPPVQKVPNKLKSSSNQGLTSILQKSPEINGVANYLSVFCSFGYVCWLL